MEALLEEDPGRIEKERRPLFRKDRYLSSALLTSEIDYLLTYRANKRALKKEHIQLLEKVERSDARVLKSEGFLPWAFKNWRYMGVSTEPLTPLTTALKVAEHALRISQKDYADLDNTITITPASELAMAYTVKNNFDKVIQQITYSTEFHQHYQHGRYACDAFGNLHLIWQDKTTCWLVTHVHLVALRDAINSWFDAYLYGLCTPDKYPGFNFYEEICVVLEAGRDLVASYGALSYTLIKSWPSLVIASILRDTEGKTIFFKTLESTLIPFKMTTFYKLATRALISDIQVHLALELTGLWKCFGHPDIDMDASVRTCGERSRNKGTM